MTMPESPLPPDLLPCPFCEGAVKRQETYPEYMIHYGEGDCPFAFSAYPVHKWNRRASPTLEAAACDSSWLVSRCQDALREASQSGAVRWREALEIILSQAKASISSFPSRRASPPGSPAPAPLDPLREIIASLDKFRIMVAERLGFIRPTGNDMFWGHPEIGPVHASALAGAILDRLPTPSPKGEPLPLKPHTEDTMRFGDDVALALASVASAGLLDAETILRDKLLEWSEIPAPLEGKSDLEGSAKPSPAVASIEQSRPLRPGEIIEAGDEAYVDGLGPWKQVSAARIGEPYFPWNGTSGHHVSMRRPALKGEALREPHNPNPIQGDSK